MQTKMFKDMENTWEKEWKNMPEFHQEDLTSHRKIIVHFRNDNDVKEFSELIGQKITQKLPSLWFPSMPPRRYADKLYVDEEE